WVETGVPKLCHGQMTLVASAWKGNYIFECPDNKGNYIDDYLGGKNEPMPRLRTALYRWWIPRPDHSILGVEEDFPDWR
ncbi:MAG: hypothetical protein AABN33_18170, partial [Acidobacteriota bacterium]